MDNFIIDANENKTGVKMNVHDYRGFTIEPIIGGFNIVLYGRKHTFYFAGEKGFDLSTDADKAKSFRTCEYCYRMIDELIKDHFDWIRMISKKKILTE